MNRPIGRIALAALTVLAAALLAGCGTQEAEASNEFAQCLTAQGAAMYGTSWCGHCQNQKAFFGPSFAHITYIDCEDDPRRCDAAGVRGFPTWIIRNVSYPGEQTIEQLSRLTGCPT